MFDLIRGAVVMLVALIGAVLETQTSSIVVLVGITVAIAAAVVATRCHAPIPPAPGTQHGLALHVRAATLVRPSGTAPRLRRSHRARAPGHAA